MTRHRLLSSRPCLRDVRACATRRSARGFSLLEVVLALAVLIVAVLALAQAFAFTGRATQQGRRLTMAAVLAEQKLAQLRGLAWSYDSTGVRVSDVQTNTAAMPEVPAGGAGLQPSPPGTLDGNIDGYCDVLDATGRILAACPPSGPSGGFSVPDGTSFIRRWSITPLPVDPLDTLIVRVRLLSREAAESGAADPAGVTLTTLRTRMAA